MLEIQITFQHHCSCSETIAGLLQPQYTYRNSKPIQLVTATSGWFNRVKLLRRPVRCN